jgi:filamentous hemagglutinin
MATPVLLTAVDQTMGAVARFSRISGGHNAHEAIERLNARGQDFEMNATATPGIFELIIPNPNDPTKFQIKTVYDPAVYSDAQMINMARDAGALAWNQLTQSGGLVDGAQPRITVGGITFEVRINAEAGSGRLIIGSVYPVDPTKK